MKSLESADDVIEALSSDHHSVPVAALEAADRHREALREPLLAVLASVIDDPFESSEESEQLFSYALYLLAKWREPRALPLVCRFLSIPGQLLFDLGGDIPTQNGPSILAGVSGGQTEPIKALILNTRANEYGRSAGINALAALGVWGEVPMEDVAAYFQWLAEEGLEREHSQVWNSLAGTSAELVLTNVFPALRRAYEERLVDPRYMAASDLDDAERAGTRADDLMDLVQYRPITDVAEAVAWWDFTSADEDRESVPAPGKVGRNDPCPCGSGKKYKRCHGGM